jgi:signal transduction histidine kinase
VSWSECNGPGEGAVDQLRKELNESRHWVLCGKLVSGLAHEINNPLDGVINSVRLIKSGKLPPERTQEYLGMIESELFRIASLTKRLLGLSREHPLQRVSTDLNELVTKALFFIDYRMNLNGVHLERQAGPLPRLKLDQTTILQVLVNLLLNAIESMPEGGRLLVKTAADKDWVRVSVADTGTGISEENIGRIFYPFFTTKKSTGLGLSVSMNVAEQHGGNIDVESTVGKGSIFTLRLPCR